MSLLFASGGQSTGASASASVLPMNIQDWFSLGWTSLISLQFKGLSGLLQHHSSKASFLWDSAFFIVQLSHPYMITGKAIALTGWTFDGKVMSLLFNMLSRYIRLCVCSVAKSCSTLCDPIDCSKPGFCALHYLPEFAQIHVHWVNDAI